MHAQNAIYKTGSGSRLGPRGPRGSRQARVRLAGCNLQPPEMMPAPKKSWFGSWTAEQTRFEDGRALQYINNYRSNPAAPDLCRILL
jgi:hypothetical protein